MTSGDATAASSMVAPGSRAASVVAPNGMSPPAARCAASVALGLLDLVVVGLDAGVVFRNRRIRRLHVRLGQRLLLLDELLQAVDVGDEVLLPAALLIVAREIAWILPGLAAIGFRCGRSRRRRGGGCRGCRCLRRGGSGDGSEDEFCEGTDGAIGHGNPPRNDAAHS